MRCSPSRGGSWSQPPRLPSWFCRIFTARPSPIPKQRQRRHGPPRAANAQDAGGVDDLDLGAQRTAEGGIDLHQRFQSRFAHRIGSPIGGGTPGNAGGDEHGARREAGRLVVQLHAAGEHALYLGINRAGDAKSPDEVALNTKPGAPVDSVTAFEPAAAAVFLAGAGLAAAGVGLLAWLFYVRKRLA